MEQSWKRAKAIFAIILGPPLAWLLLFFLIPLTIVWVFSFGTNVGLTEIAFTGTFSNYARAIEPLYVGIFLKSVGVAGLTTLLCLIVGFPVALAITFAPDRLKAWLILLVMLPFWTNLLIRTYALIAVLRTEGYVNLSLGWLWTHASGLMTMVGLSPLTRFEPLELLHNNFAVVFGLVYVHLPFMVLPLYSALDRLDRSLLEASLDLGAGHFRTMMMVVVPLALPGIASGILITFIPALGAYLTPDLLGGPDSQMIANIIESQLLKQRDQALGSALSVTVMLIVAVVSGIFLLLNRRFLRGQK